MSIEASTPPLWACIESIAPKTGCVAQTLHEWVKQHEIDTGVSDGLNTDERERIEALEREVKRTDFRRLEMLSFVKT